jgi:hypothetical protein
MENDRKACNLIVIRNEVKGLLFGGVVTVSRTQACHPEAPGFGAEGPMHFDSSAEKACLSPQVDTPVASAKMHGSFARKEHALRMTIVCVKWESFKAE